MHLDTESNSAPWDLERLRIPLDRVGLAEVKHAPPRHRPGEPFLKGPIPFDWMATACRLPGSGLQVVSAVRFLCDRFGRGNRWGLAKIAESIGISSDSAERGLHAAEEAGLVSAVREPGCKRVLSVESLPEPAPGVRNQSLSGPIPWNWWDGAMRLPGKSLQVAMACWFSAGWIKAGEFELGLSEWAELGLTRFSAGRGLECLSRAGLAEVTHRSGRRPTVRLLEARGSVSGGLVVESGAGEAERAPGSVVTFGDIPLNGSNRGKSNRTSQPFSHVLPFDRVEGPSIDDRASARLPARDG